MPESPFSAHRVHIGGAENAGIVNVEPECRGGKLAMRY